MSTPPKIGVSACLLGEKVRYNGGHKLDRYLRDTLGPHVEWVEVCPEVGCGLPVPRNPMHLSGTIDAPRLVTTKSGIDHSAKMQRWIEQELIKLEREELCGFIFKTGSPSCGKRSIKVDRGKGRSVGRRAGLFADAFMKAFPSIPVEDEARLHDAGLRENFIERIFTMHRWRTLCKSDWATKT